VDCGLLSVSVIKQLSLYNLKLNEDKTSFLVQCKNTGGPAVENV